jgi:hypothetical protein
MQVVIHGAGGKEDAYFQLAFAVVFCVTLAGEARAQGTPTATISGYILDPHGLPVPRSSIVLENASTGGRRVVSRTRRVRIAFRR